MIQNSRIVVITATDTRTKPAFVQNSSCRSNVTVRSMCKRLAHRNILCSDIPTPDRSRGRHGTICNKNRRSSLFSAKMFVLTKITRSSFFISLSFLVTHHRKKNDISVRVSVPKEKPIRRSRIRCVSKC